MDYTGIENIYMNGTMMGYTKAEMEKKLQEILDFADIGDFVYQPVKTYSSGMFVRLAFALAINVEPRSLLWTRPCLWATCFSRPSATGVWRRSGRTAPPS